MENRFQTPATKEDIHKIELKINELRVEIIEARTDLLKWIAIIVWITIMLFIVIPSFRK